MASLRSCSAKVRLRLREAIFVVIVVDVRLFCCYCCSGSRKNQTSWISSFVAVKYVYFAREYGMMFGSRTDDRQREYGGSVTDFEENSANTIKNGDYFDKDVYRAVRE